MFKCTKCKFQVAVNQPMNKVVVQSRDRRYENFLKRGYERGRTFFTNGWEIVKEIAVCPRCYKSITGLEPKTKEPTPPRKIEPKFKDEESNRKYGNKNKQPHENKHKKPPVVQVINPITLEKS